VELKNDEHSNQQDDPEEGFDTDGETGRDGPGRCRVDRTAEGTWRRHNGSGSQASPDAEFSPCGV
jgi:hypothetical protein